jgi:hypothetical protein
MVDRTAVFIGLIFHTVCLSYLHHHPFYRRTRQLSLVQYKIKSNLHQDSIGIENEANRILQYIHKSPRDIVTIDILRSFESISGNDISMSRSSRSYVEDNSDNRVNLSKQVLLEVMTKLVERRDHVRFGDMLSVYAMKKNENTDTAGDIDRSSSNKSTSHSSIQIFSTLDQEDNAIHTTIQDTHHKATTIIDMDILMLLIITLQRMKPKKRQSQSLELLQKVLLLAFHFKIVNTFVLSMILIETEHLDESQLTQYKNSIAVILDSNRNDIEYDKFTDIDISNKSTNINHFINGIIQRKNLEFIDLNFADFVPSNVFMLGMLTLLLMPLAGLYFCVGLDSVTPSL